MWVARVCLTAPNARDVAGWTLFAKLHPTQQLSALAGTAMHVVEVGDGDTPAGMEALAQVAARVEGRQALASELSAYLEGLTCGPGGSMAASTAGFDHVAITLGGVHCPLTL